MSETLFKKKKQLNVSIRFAQSRCQVDFSHQVMLHWNYSMLILFPVLSFRGREETQSYPFVWPFFIISVSGGQADTQSTWQSYRRAEECSAQE